MCKNDDKEELAFISDFCKGDLVAFNRAYFLFYETIFLFAKNILANYPDAFEQARDITSESFVKLWKLRSKFKSTDNIKAFLYITSKNSCLNHIRSVSIKNRAQREILHLSDQATTQPMEREIMLSELVREIKAEIDKLPTTMGTVIKLSLLEGKETDDIIAKLSINKSNFYSHKSEGTKRLKRALSSRNIYPAFYIMVTLLSSISRFFLHLL